MNNPFTFLKSDLSNYTVFVHSITASLINRHKSVTVGKSINKQLPVHRVVYSVHQ